MAADKATETCERARRNSVLIRIQNEASDLLRDRKGFGWMNYIFVMAAIGTLVVAGGQPLVDHMTQHLRVVSDYSIGLLSR